VDLTAEIKISKSVLSLFGALYVSQFENKSVPLKPYLKRAQLAMYITQTMKAWSSDTVHFLMSKNVWQVKQIQPNIITSAF